MNIFELAHQTRAEKNLLIVRVSAYPLLLLAAVITVAVTLKHHINFAVTNGLFLGYTISYLAVMERLIPYDALWHPSKKEWLRDGIYLVLTMFGGGLAMAVVLQISAQITTIPTRMPLFMQIIVAILISSLGSYAFHRASHVQPWLWRMHGIHHVEAKVNVGNNGVNHILDVFLRRLVAQTPLIFLGISDQALFIVSIFNTVQGYFVHANIDVKLRWLNYIVVSPAQHRLHHSKNLDEAGHFSVDIPLWDIVFSSFFWHAGRTPKAIGVVNPKKFPSPDHIWISFISPFIKRTRQNKTK